VFVVVRQSRRTFVEKVDFITSVGHGRGKGDRERLGLPGAGPVLVITDLGVLRPDPETSELTLTELHPGVELEQVREATGWELKVSPELSRSPEPTEHELTVLRALKEAR
jgi:glutaconate CoA-transferase subunit B